MVMQQTQVDSRPRRVRFSEESNQRVEFERAESEVENAWWPKEVGQERRETCHQLGRAWQRKGYDVLLDSAFEKPAHGTQSKLDSFAMLGNDDGIPRGIERFISSTHAEDRRFCKTHCLEAVVDQSSFMRRDNTKTMEEMEAALYKLSTEHSRCARKFARRMAIADERAVREDNGLTNEQQVPEDQPATVSAPSKDIQRGFSSRAIKNTKRITKMIAGHMRNGHPCCMQIGCCHTEDFIHRLLVDWPEL